MKKRTIFLLFMIISTIVFGQDLKVDIGEVNVTPPKFTGIEIEKTALTSGSIEAYLKDNMIFPENNTKWLREGTEVVQFVITDKGEVTDFVVINSLSSEIDGEVIRVLQTTSGKWLPGYNNDQLLTMPREVSIAFKISGFGKETDFKAVAKKHYSQGTKLLINKDKPAKAIKSFDKAIVFLPNDMCLLSVRGLAKYEVGDKEGAYQDWNRLKKLGNNFGDYYLTDFEHTKGYPELISILGK